MIGDLQRLQDISQELSVTIQQPNVLPEKSIEYITEMCPLASKVHLNDIQGVCVVYGFITACYLCLVFSLDSLSVSYGTPDSQRRGSYTPQPQRAMPSDVMSRRS